MPESKDIIVDSIYRKRSDEPDSHITITPAVETKNTIQAIMNIEPDSHFYNNKEVIAGELCLVLKNNKTDIDFDIDTQGNLVVSGEDSKNYSINDQGELIYTFR